MESMYWNSFQQWTLVNKPAVRSTDSVTDKPAAYQADTVNESVLPDTVAQESTPTTDSTSVMKRFLLIAIGLLLFVATYLHIHRQAEYVTNKSTLSIPEYNTVSTPVDVRPAPASPSIRPM